MTNAATVAIAADIRIELAGQALTERQAKLYSQQLRRDMGREGLASFVESDVVGYLDEAMLLLESGWIERGANIASLWRTSIKRAAEILEWLSQSHLRPKEAPLHLLAAAAYQLADFPAMALGHLRRVPHDEPLSRLLTSFLRADFPGAAFAAQKFWNNQHSLDPDDRIDPAGLEPLTEQHIVMCIGTICAFLRTGGDVPVERALTKLERLAASYLHSRDSYSYLLARLTAASARRFVQICLWHQIDRLRLGSSTAAAGAFTQFARSAFTNRRTLVWPAQAEGIERLRDNTSFVLCTPTGSGKTTVATLGAVQALFADPAGIVDTLAAPMGNLVLYLVPSRALAAEVEGRLAEDLHGVAASPVVVTGLYGGVDWGPTDAWIQTVQPTVVICTFEKADALLRYLGVLFLDRVRTIIIDEAHMVEQDRAKLTDLRNGTSRAFRIEQLGSRLLRARDQYNFRIIALSAVAAQAAPALARWVSGDPEAAPTTSAHRSTRQMLGRLEIAANGQFSIHYSLMDGHSLKFDDERRDDSPFVPNVFPPLPGGLNPAEGPDVRMRAPTLWAALNLAAQRADGSTPSVLISLTQNVGSFAKTCADLMDAWQDLQLPDYWAIDESNEIWTRCLATAIDYFTANSVEYRLLARGIVVHHGKMPGLLARRLKMVIERGFARIIIATSTLSEGVNIPVNFLLIPSVFRGHAELPLQEFTNLIGRAGRPGVATEGSALVVLPERTYEYRYGRRVPTFNRQWNGYESLIRRMREATAIGATLVPDDQASSSLGHLLQALQTAWVNLTGDADMANFTVWLEQTAVAPAENGEASDAQDYLDALDAFLIAAIAEVEELRNIELADGELEEELARIWRRTYAFATAQSQAQLTAIWLGRGRAIKRHYPDAVQRRRLYRTSLTPRAGKALLNRAELIRVKLTEGEEYALFNTEHKISFIRDVLALLSEVPAFRIQKTLGRKQDFDDWPTILRWWLAKGTLTRQPRADEITNWYSFVAHNFIYRGAWGIGSVIGLLLDTTDDGQPIKALEIADWPRTGLPWIAFWLKEIINWGTLDPVAAFLLARGDAIDRPQAENDALLYYSGRETLSPNELLDPRTIRDWVETRRPPRAPKPIARALSLPAALSRPATDFRQDQLLVSPLAEQEALIWLDPAGYEVARTLKPLDWPQDLSIFQFELSVSRSIVLGELYLPHH